MARLTRFALALATALALSAAPALGQPSSGGDASREQQRLTAAESYVPLPTMSTAVLVQSRVRGAIVVDVGLDVPDAGLRARAQAMSPRLVDALRTALSNYAGAYYRERTAPEPATLARLMQVSVDRTLGRPGARLLLSNIVYQQRS